MFRSRLRIDLAYEGENREEISMALLIAVGSAGVCLVTRDVQPPADTTIYGKLRIARTDSGGFEIATSLGGPHAKRSQCENRRAAVVYRDLPILWGVVMTGVVRTFVACAVAARADAAAR